MPCYDSITSPYCDVGFMLNQEGREIVLIIGADGHIMAANNAALCAYGYMDSEIAGIHISQLRGTSTVPLVSTQMELASVQGIVFETVHKRKDNSTFPVKVYTQSLSIDGKPALLSVLRDASAEDSICAETRSVHIE